MKEYGVKVYFHEFVTSTLVYRSYCGIIKKRVKQSHTGPKCPEDSRKIRFPDYVTMAQDGGKVVSLTHRPLLPSGNTPGTHFC
jgi:hypothetical protein